MLAAVLGTAGYMSAKAQSATENNIAVPESYMQEQGISEPAGTSTVSTLEYDTTQGISYASTQTQVSFSEPINIYSGKHDGNNVVRTIEVALPEGSPTTGFTYREYQPK